MDENVLKDVKKYCTEMYSPECIYQPIDLKSCSGFWTFKTSSSPQEEIDIACSKLALTIINLELKKPFKFISFII